MRNLYWIISGTILVSTIALPVGPEIARENRDKYLREGHEVMYVELPGVGHRWGSQAGVNETIWKFFAGHPKGKQ